jgi:hypothetical protein
MAAKEVVFADEARQRVFKGVNIFVNAVKATLGPKGTMRRSNPIVWKLMLCTAALAVVCALNPGSAVTGLVQNISNLAVPATALGFTLITAANRDRQ